MAEARLTVLLRESDRVGNEKEMIRILDLCDDIYYTGKPHSYQGIKYGMADLPKDEVYDAYRKKSGTSEKPHYVRGHLNARNDELIPHDYPMGSLAKYEPSSVEKLQTIFTRLGDRKDSLAITLKLDGVSLQTHFVNGKLVKAVTRHDHTLGRSIIDVATLFVVHPDPSFEGEVVVGGEVLLSLDEYKELGYAHPRSGASGILARHDRQKAKYLHYVAYELLDFIPKSKPRSNPKSNPESMERTEVEAEVGEESKSMEGEKGGVIRTEAREVVPPHEAIPHSKARLPEDSPPWPTSKPTTIPEQFALLNRLGIETSPLLLKGQETLNAPVLEQLLIEMRKGYPYPSDGLVICPVAWKVETADPPKMKVAYKVQSEGDWTTVVAIEPRATRTGYVIPQITVEPVHVGGVVITSVAGSNYSILNEKGIRTGSHVHVVKAKEVIPFINEVDNEGVDTVQVPLPIECPSCSTSLLKDNRSLRCPNPSCPAKMSGQVEHFLTTIGVKSLGANRIQKLGVETIYDLYTLSIADIISIEGFKTKMAQSIYNQLRNCINPIEEWVLLEAICPQHIGEKTAKLITEHIPLDELFNTDPKQRLMAIKGIGPARGKGIIDFHRQGASLLAMLRQHGLKTTRTPIHHEPVQEGGEVICLTGKGLRKRDAYDSLIKEKGWQVSESVGQRVTLVVTNNLEGDTDKLRKARALSIRIILYEELEKMLSS